jgi:hypothetical protein
MTLMILRLLSLIPTTLRLRPELALENLAELSTWRFRHWLLLTSFYLPLKKAFMPDLTQSRSADAKFDCNILSRKALDPSQQQLMAEAPVSIPADDLPCAMEGALRRSPRVDSLLLQLRQASQGAEIRTRGPDTGHAGGIDHQAADVQGDLLLDDEFFGAAKHHTCVLRLNHVGQCGRFAPFHGGLATPDGGSTDKLGQIEKMVFYELW